MLENVHELLSVSDAYIKKVAELMQNDRYAFFD